MHFKGFMNLTLIQLVEFTKMILILLAHKVK